VLRFTATECGSRIDADGVLCGASNAKDAAADPHSLIFARSLAEGEDQREYFELDDQSQGFHGGVSNVSFRGRTMVIVLAPPRGRTFGHRTIEVELRCPAREVQALKKGLRVIFRGYT
jgi:hypothetical protein